MPVDNHHTKRLMERREIMMNVLKDSVRMSLARLHQEKEVLAKFGNTTYSEAQMEIGILIGLWFHLCACSIDIPHLKTAWDNKEARAKLLSQYLTGQSEYYKVLLDVDFDLINLDVHTSDNFSVH